MFKTISTAAIDVLRFVNGRYITPENICDARGDGSVDKVNSMRSYMRRLAGSDLLQSYNITEKTPVFTITDTGRFVLWLWDHGVQRTSGKWYRGDTKLTDVEYLDLREEYEQYERQTNAGGT